MDIVQILLISLPAILFALTVHEFAHAYIAYKLGDPTAKDLGRVTLNPIAHLDPIGTFMIIFTRLGGYGIGWGKPVPVDDRYLKDPKKDLLWIALAGPASNIILAFIFGFICRIMLGLPYSDTLQTVFSLAYESLIINLGLCFFNLIPIAPLDGSKILAGLLPDRQSETYMYYATQYGPMILIGIVVLGQVAPDYSIIRYVIVPPIKFFIKLFSGIDV